MLWTAQGRRADGVLCTGCRPVPAGSCGVRAYKRDCAPFFRWYGTNGLFLAVVRSDLFHILLPQSWQEGIGSLLVMLAAGILPAYGMLTGGAKRTPVRVDVFGDSGDALGFEQPFRISFLWGRT